MLAATDRSRDGAPPKFEVNVKTCFTKKNDWLLTLKPRSLNGESNSRAPFVADSTFSQNPLKPCFNLCLSNNIESNSFQEETRSI